MKQIVAMLAVLFTVAVTPVEADDNFFATNIILPDVYIRPGVTADIDVLVLKNKHHRFRHGQSIVALHGLANTANTWKPLANELFSNRLIGRGVCSILAINLPGRGYSGLPKGGAGLLFGDLALEDHVQAVVGTLERIRKAGFNPRTIMAHSQGGLIVQMVQHALLEDGSSLRDEFGIDKAVLMASIGPAEVSWLFADSGYGQSAVGSFVVPDDVELGTHLAIPDAEWLGLFFVDNPEARTLVANAPIEEVTTEGYNSPEPSLASLQLVGSETFKISRPEVASGLFDNTGTRLRCIAMSRDGFQSVDEQAELYEYLTNDISLERFTVVESDDAVHSMYISNPRGLLEALIPSIYF